MRYICIFHYIIWPFDVLELAELEEVKVLEPEEDFQQLLLPVISEMLDDNVALTQEWGRAYMQKQQTMADGQYAHPNKNTGGGEASEESTLNHLQNPNDGVKGRVTKRNKKVEEKAKD
uniref:Uncharacterized protein n=1 Tax=Panthera leo TaxID=9689 RepID=A0A8C8Y5S8_PANLE